MQARPTSGNRPSPPPGAPTRFPSTIRRRARKRSRTFSASPAPIPHPFAIALRSPATTREEFMRFLRWVQENSLRFDGSAYRTMLRNDAYWFSRLGVYMERADNTARILDVKYHLLLPVHERIGGPLDYFQWAAILRSVSRSEERR